MVTVRTRAARYLAARTRVGVKFGLATMRALAEALGHPERAYPTTLVAGTNGKGSVVAYVDAALRASGLRTGRYISPHLQRVNERIAVDGRDIDTRALARVVDRVRAAAEQLRRAGRIDDHPTYFEALTAAALLHFREQAVDFAVLEVGMGARLDATNIARPMASAIVTVDRDHEAFLGQTLAAIAREKAGVLRRGRVTVVGRLPAEARAAVGLRAERVGARLVDAEEDVAVTRRGGALAVRTPRHSYPSIRALAGAHQRDNAVLALRLLEALEEAGAPVDLDRAGEAFGHARWPGRLQWVAGRPPLLLDGAHNPAAARALARYLREIGSFVLLFGVLADKDVAAMGRILFPLARAVVITAAPSDRGASPQEVVERVGAPAANAVLEADVGRALARARALAGRMPVVVAGSLYLVGRVLRMTQRAPSRPRQ
ncbi:MAG TPA: cyanophycin synthetase [Vicinamibacteria bacterium]|jgi:dihydrofolate synthase/folylpolyglutamate synthase